MEQKFIYFYLKDKDNNKLLPIGSFSNDIETFNQFQFRAFKEKLRSLSFDDLKSIEQEIDSKIELYNLKVTDVYDYKEILDELNFAKFLCQYFYKILYEYQWVNETTDEKYIYVGIDCPNATAEDIIE